MFVHLVMVVKHGWEIKAAEFPYVNDTYYGDIFSYLREQFNTENLTVKNQVTATNSSKYDDNENDAKSDRKKVDCILFNPLVYNVSRFLTKDEPKPNVPWIILDFHEIKITVKSYMIFYYNSQNIKRWMKSYTMYGYGPTGWEIIHQVRNKSPDELPKNQDGFWFYKFNVTHIGTYSMFKITNDGSDSYGSNILSLSKLLFFGRVEGGKAKFSPIKLERKTQFLLNLGMMEASELF